MNHPRRRRRLSNWQLCGLLVLSLLGHSALLLVRLHRPVVALSPRTAQPVQALQEELRLDVACAVDAVLAAAARTVYAATPLVRDRRGAWSAAGLAMRMELVGCYTAPEQPEVALLTPAQVAAIEPAPLLPTLPLEEPAQQKPQETPQQQEQAQRELAQIDRSAQVVELVPPRAEVRPDEARYLSEYDSRAERETVARGSTEKMVDKPAPAHLPPSTRPTPTPDQTAASRSDARPNSSVAVEPPEEARTDKIQRAELPGDGKAPGALAMREPSQRDTAGDAREAGEAGAPASELTADGLLPRRGAGGAGTRSVKEDSLLPPRGEGGQGGAPAEREVPNLRPSQELLARAVGGGSVDHLEGVDEGESTALNTKRWKFATFFNRVKRQVAQNWHPDRVYLQRDPQGNVYGFKDRVTEVRVSLNMDGTLAQIHILRPSGVDFLDEEALRAFQAAQPFPNPPRGLVDESSRLITFKFGFHFMIGGRPGAWRVYRDY